MIWRKNETEEEKGNKKVNRKIKWQSEEKKKKTK